MQLLARELERTLEDARRDAASEDVPFDEETLEGLRALGYVE